MVALVWLAVGVSVAAVAAVELLAGLHHAGKRVARTLDPEGLHGLWRARSEVYDGQPWAPDYWREYHRLESVWSPYVMWSIRPRAGTYVNVDAEGRRRTWASASASASVAGRPVVWLFGGSTMFGMGSRDDFTIASVVAKALEAEGGAHVVNHGQPGWVMSQSAIALAEALKQGRRPDVVVFYDGANDVFAAVTQDKVGLPQNSEKRTREFNLVNPKRRAELLREAVLGLLPHTTALIPQLTGADGLTPLADEELARRSEEMAEYMGATARQVRALGAAYGFKTVFVLQPMIFDKPNKTPFEQRAAVQVHMAKPYDVAYERLRADAGFAGQGDFLDLSRMFADVSDAMFVDFWHLGEPGDARVGQAIAQAVRPLLPGRDTAR